MTKTPSVAALRLRALASRARTLAAVYFLILFAATHLPGIPTSGFSLSDKLLHLVAFAFLTFCMLVGWETNFGRLAAKHYFAVWLAGTMYGILDEVTQIPVGRSCDINDWAADVLGVVVGMVAFGLMRGTVYRLLLGADPATARSRRRPLNSWASGRGSPRG